VKPYVIRWVAEVAKVDAYPIPIHERRHRRVRLSIVIQVKE